jgi:hypothetical protein
MDMLTYENWIFYKLVWNEAKGKFEKYPLNPRTGGMASSTDPATWASWSEVRSRWDNARGEAAGIGFTLDNNPFWCIDLDGVYDTATGVWDKTALAVMSMFPTGVYMEWSVSGKGVHIFGVGQKPPGVGSKSADRKIEIYDSGRFIAMTFNTIAGSWAGMTDQTNALANVCAMWLPPKTREEGPSAIDWGCGPIAGYDGPTDDDVLIQMMMSDVVYNFNRTVSIPDLWNKNEAVLAERFPDDGGRAWDWSAADLSLMNAIADFTGDDPDRMDRIFRRSGLFREERWEESRFNYRNRTILKALARPTKKTFRVAPVVIDQPVVAGEAMTFGEILTPQEQVEFFRGCCYVMSRNEMFLPDGTFVRPDTFKSGFYAGHLFIIDMTGKTTANAWEAFTQNRAVRFPKVMRTCFRPDLTPGVVKLRDEMVLNTYVPVATKRIYGADVSRFTGHLEKMFPNERDREIIINFMAAVVQYPGIKFQWCPVIQGTEGNGKSMLIRAITAAVGERYTHSVNSATLADGGGKFNKWLENKLFIDFEEIYTGDRMDMMEILKPIVTNPRLEIQGKGMDQYTGDNRANMMMATNHKNAIIKTAKDRRYAVIYTAQQSYEDCLRDGMDDEYFSSIYDWLSKEDGYAAVAGWLASYPIREDLNPATKCQRAPRTSSMGEAIRESLGVVEQHIMEWVDSERTGFRGGWISSAKLEDALKDAGLASRVAPNRRKAILDAIGYQLHPGLAEGKCPIELMAEGGRRPRLYATGSVLDLTDRNAICAAYCTAQGYGA